MSYYLLHSPKFWLCAILGGMLVAALWRRISFSLPSMPKLFAGHEKERQQKKEFRQLQKAAEKGDADAQLKLGDACYTGTSVKRDQKKAVEWYQLAAAQDNAEAYLKLGDVFSKGAYSKDIVFDDGDPTAGENDIAKDENEAMRWYIKAALKGLPKAQKRLLEMETRLHEKLMAPLSDEESKTAEITCGEAPNDYQVFLTARSLNVFKEASDDPAFPSRKKGEDFVAALLKRGGILKVERHKNGWFSDGPKGEPAVQIFDANGTLTCVMHYKDNRLNDGAKGEPAFQTFSITGTPLRLSHFKAGLRHDGVNGEAPFLLFSDDGKLIWAVHYKDDQIIKALTAHEIATYFETSKIAKSIETALPGIKIH